MKKFVSKSEKETLEFARRLALKLKGGDIVLLEGDLGAGKTTFVKGLAQAFGIKEPVRSPTFVLMHVHKIKNIKIQEYKNIKNFAHIDAYRIKHPIELRDAGLMDWLGRPDTITVAEWGEKIKPLLRGMPHIVIKFQHGKKENERLILITV